MISPASFLASLSSAEREAHLAKLTPETRAALKWHWPFWARPNQLAPDGMWATWLLMSGRGFGKTESGAQWVKARIEGGAKHIALVAETQKDLEEVMVPRLVAIHRPEDAPTVRYRPVRMTWPSGATALGYNGTEPNQLRGPEFDTAWVDELAKYRYAQETWDMLQFTMRKGDDPRVVVTTTPRPIPLLKSLLADAGTVITTGTTFDNADNLPAKFVEGLRKRYGGTRLGRQELYAEVLGDIPGALWYLAQIDGYRLTAIPENMGRILVAVDPAVTAHEESDEHGVIVAGLSGQDGIVLHDGSLRGSPLDWARRAISLHDSYGADGIVVEVNQGGDMVAQTLRSVRPNINVIEVRATRGKHVRAEPIAALYEQGRVRHVGAFPELESQMTQMTAHGYEGPGSPDRVDALVWAMTELFPDMVDAVPDVSRFEIGASRGWMGA
jgi:phage terminase large subunit-like protein